MSSRCLEKPRQNNELDQVVSRGLSEEEFRRGSAPKVGDQTTSEGKSAVRRPRGANRRAQVWEPRCRGTSPRRRRRRNAKAVEFRYCGANPTCLGATESLGISGRIGQGEATVAVVQQYRHRQLAPGCGENEIRHVIAVDVACRDLQSACGSDDADGMQTGSGQMKLNPVVCKRQVAAPGLDDRQIRPQVAVKIRKGKGSIGQN